MGPSVINLAGKPIQGAQLKLPSPDVMRLNFGFEVIKSVIIVLLIFGLLRFQEVDML